MPDGNEFDSAFLKRIGEPLTPGVRISEETGEKLIKNMLTALLNKESLTQAELLSLGGSLGECAEKFNLQHLAAGGWTPMNELL